MEEKDFAVTLSLEDGFRFDTSFDDPDMAGLRMDEPRPLGEGSGPNAARVLGAAVGNCLSASLLFCLRRARVDVGGMRTEVKGSLVRNEQGRWRIGRIAVRILTDIPIEDQPRVARCLEVFEDFCIVTGSVRSGVEVDVEVDVSSGSGPASG